MMGTKTRSALVSLFTAGGEVLIFGFCTLMLAGPALVLARWVWGAVGSGANFLLNRSLVFKSKRRSAGEMARFVTCAVAAVTISTTLWWTLARLTGADLRVLHVISMMSVWLLFTYPVMKRWVFGGCADRTRPARGSSR